MPGTVARVGSHRNLSVWIKWTLAFALSACLVPSVASAQTEVKATPSQWTYFYKYKQALGCYSTDIAAANAVIADAAASGNYCDASFSQWTTAWPNGVGITDQFNICLPPDVSTPFNWAMQHWEDRTAKYTYRSSCGSNPSDEQAIITRHFLYYCDANHFLYKTSNDPIPVCRINPNASDPKKQTRGCCASQGNTSVGDPIDVATGNMFDRETDYGAMISHPCSSSGTTTAVGTAAERSATTGDTRTIAVSSTSQSQLPPLRSFIGRTAASSPSTTRQAAGLRSPTSPLD